MEQKLIAGPIKGYKATDENMKCRDFQFEIGKIYELDNQNPLELCQNGFHFCEQPSGPWAYYAEGKIFEIEAWDVLESEFQTGVDYKRVCRKIRLIKEIQTDGSRNTGDRNTGDRNTGSRNTGNRNTGDRNTGSRNTGNRNTGDGNTGYGNTGYGNTGDRNTGNRNTGNRNTGDGNTGYGNIGNYHSGLFCSMSEPPLYMFDKIVKGGKRKSLDYARINQLSYLLSRDEEFDPDPFLSLPNATKEKIKKLHQKHIKARKIMKNGLDQ